MWQNCKTEFELKKNILGNETPEFTHVSLLQSQNKEVQGKGCVHSCSERAQIKLFVYYIVQIFILPQ